MSGPELRARADFARNRPWTANAAAPAPHGIPAPTTTTATASRAARALALAHKVEAMLLAGEIPSYNAAARALGMNQPQMSRLIGLLALSPAIQERILLGTLRISERRLRVVAKLAPWDDQEGRLSDRAGPF